MKDALIAVVDHLERMQIRLHGTVPPVAAREIAKMRQILASPPQRDEPPKNRPVSA